MFKRVATGIIAGLVFAAAIFAPVPGLFACVIATLLVLAALEWAHLCRLRSYQKYFYTGILFAIYLCFLWLGKQSTAPMFQLLVIAFWLWILAIPLIIRYSQSQAVFSNRLLTLSMGAIFMLSTSVALVWLKSLDQGNWRVVLLVGLVAVADTCALLAGRRFGRNKLAAAISPAKTFEGVYGGFLGNFVLTTLVVMALKLSVVSNLMLFVLVFGSNGFSIVGDLIESAVKRNSGAKDSGDWLPGHGGILDRIDGLMAATPFFALATMLFSPLS